MEQNIVDENMLLVLEQLALNVPGATAQDVLKWVLADYCMSHNPTPLHKLRSSYKAALEVGQVDF